MILRFGIITASDRSSRGERPDLSGPELVREVKAQGWSVVRTSILADEKDIISETLAQWADSGDLDIILVTGGTGFAPRDITPEATLAVIHRQVPGMAEVMRQESLKITPHAILSRGVCGIRGSVLIINLPGSPRAALENLSVVIPVLEHATELLRGDGEAEKHHVKPLA